MQKEELDAERQEGRKKREMKKDSRGMGRKTECDAE